MNTDRSKEIKVGIVTLASVLLLIAGITIGKGLAAGVARNTVQFRFPSSGGIEIGSPLFINGVKRGAVVSVRNDNGAVQISAGIDDFSDLHADASARIMMLELTGGKKIELNPGTAKAAFDPSKEIQGNLSADATELIALVGELGGDARTIVRRLDSLLTQANALLGDGQVVAKLRNTVNNADQMIYSLNTFVQGNKDDLRSLVQELNGLATDARKAVNVNEPRVRSLITRLDSLAGAGQHLLARVDTAVAGANGMVGDIRGMVKDIQTNQSVVSRLLYDKSLSVKLDSTVHILNDFLFKVHEHGLNTNVRLGTRP
jgi:phospholipid/cholesterol/gamma-HCH transport system substrate-binding protein